jgi:hypothetical protein
MNIPAKFAGLVEDDFGKLKATRCLSPCEFAAVHSWVVSAGGYYVYACNDEHGYWRLPDVVA